jgi:hypothetical protein
VSAGLSKSTASPLLEIMYSLSTVRRYFCVRQSHSGRLGLEPYQLVFGIGIGHAGTLISAILHLFPQKWRTSIPRSVMCAGIFPTIHDGRIWIIWFVAPVPNQNWIWPIFAAPQPLDVRRLCGFHLFTYFTISVLFWYLGLVPDLATRDRATGKVRRATTGYSDSDGIGGNRQWHH